MYEYTLSFQTDRSGQTAQTLIRLLLGSSLIRVYTVCHSVCIVWTHYSMVEPYSSNFRVITNFLGVRKFRKFTVVFYTIIVKLQKLWTPKKCYNYPIISIVWFYHSVKCPKDAEEMANSVDLHLIRVYIVCSQLSVRKLINMVLNRQKGQTQTSPL